MTTTSDSNIPSYLLECFERIAKSEGFTEYTIEQNDSSKHGEGFIAAMLQVKLVGRRQVQPDVEQYDQLPLVCKLLPNNVKRRQYFSTVTLFAREAFFYNAVLPALIEFQRDKGVTEESKNGFYAFPRCYAAVADAERNLFYIIMDDLRTQTFSLWDKRRPLEATAVRLFMVALGRLHALSFALRDQQPQVFAQFEQQLDDIMLQMSKETVMQRMIEASYNLMSHEHASEQHAMILHHFKTDWLQVWQSILRPQAADRFAVIGQGDCWNNNMMFQFDETQPTRICMLDWQMVRMGSPALDLSYYFFTSTDKRLRDEHLPELLHIYYDSVADTIRALGSDPAKLFTYADLEQQLRQFGVYGVTFAPMIQAIMVSPGEHISDMDEYADALSRCDKAEQPEFFVKFNEVTKLEYSKRVGDVIDDSMRFGWLESIVRNGIIVNGSK